MKIIIVFILLMMLFGCNSLKTYEEVNNFYKEKYSLDIEEVKNKIRKKVFRDYFKNFNDIDSSLIVIETYYYMGGNFDNLHNHTSFYIDNRRDRVYRTSQRGKLEREEIDYFGILQATNDFIISLIEKKDFERLQNLHKQYGSNESGTIQVTVFNKDLKIIDGLVFKGFIIPPIW